MMQNTLENTLFVCQCCDIHHQLVLSYDSDPEFNDSIIVHVHLSDVGFFKRLKYAVGYLFGQKSKFCYGAFSEVLLDKSTTKKLIDKLQEHYKTMV